MRGLFLAVAMAALPVGAAAQPVPGRVEAAVGGRWLGTVEGGASEALLTRPDDQPFTLFKTRHEAAGAPALDARFGVRMTATLHFEATASYGMFDLVSRVTSDFEGIPDLSVSESITQLVVEMGFVDYLPRFSIGNRAIPFVSVGVGVARQLHEGRTLSDNGGIGHLGGGLALLTVARQDAALKALGLRLDVRAVFRKGGVLFDEEVTVSPGAGASVFLRF